MSNKLLYIVSWSLYLITFIFVFILVLFGPRADYWSYLKNTPDIYGFLVTILGFAIVLYLKFGKVISNTKQVRILLFFSATNLFIMIYWVSVVLSNLRGQFPF